VQEVSPQKKYMKCLMAKGIKILKFTYLRKQLLNTVAFFVVSDLAIDMASMVPN
jgi:hypothetical protein